MRRARIVVLLVLVFSKYVYLASLTSYYTFFLIHRFDVSVQSAQLHLFVFLGAVAAGTFIGGPVGDRFGRKYVIWGSILGVLPFTLVLPYANLVLDGRAERRRSALILASAFSAILVYAQELVPGRVGLVAGLFFGFAFGIGGIGAAVLGKLADVTSIDFVYRVCAFLPAIGLLTAWLPDAKPKAHRVTCLKHVGSRCATKQCRGGRTAKTVRAVSSSCAFAFLRELRVQGACSDLASHRVPAWTMLSPQSTLSAAPVMAEASSETTNGHQVRDLVRRREAPHGDARSAMRRPRRRPDRAARANHSSISACASIPASTALTRMPNRRVVERQAPRESDEAHLRGGVREHAGHGQRRVNRRDVHDGAAARSLSSTGRTCFTHSHAPFRSTANTASHCASVISVASK